ncbi:MAG TPA: peptidyl-prolyl cis-trans isomerase [Vicinamibacterales bacterium]|nr:peptidyl-prolyl cis-trans isomerase [Vicinamibacterales bacterium]HOG27768.1 peptidyl-prolyl cis-trans isomerase [Vicinamibacterales bacterium]HPW21037.1 peptidyl-prolyl cis-trans isomerase [Vicinamibacterales bacterium]
MRHTILTVLAVVLIAAPSAAQAPPAGPPAGAGGPPQKVELLEQILVKVNGDIFTKTDLEARQIASLRQRAGEMSDEELRQAIAEITPGILVDAVDELLLLQRGKELGYKVTEEQFKRVIENIRKENKLDTDEAFESALKHEGLTLAELRKNLEKQMVINQVQQVEVLGRIGISESEARTYYDANKNEFTTPATLTLRELLVTVPTDGVSVNVAADEEAKAKAEQILARARAGEPFAALVAQFSEAPSKAGGGLVGPLSPDELNPAIRKLLEPLKPGEITEVFRAANGYALLQVETMSTPEVRSFEDARDAIAQKVYEGKRLTEVQKYMRKLRGEAIIEWKNADMEKLWMARTSPETAPKSPGH